MVLADDHAIIRGGIRALLDAERDFDVVEEAGDVTSAVEAVAAHHPDLAVVDLHMPGAVGVELIASLDAVAPDTRVVVLTMETDPAVAARALRAGAAAYVLKEAAPRVLLEALRAALAGEIYLQPEVGARLAMQPSVDPLDRLSERERAVLVGIASGQTNREIASSLFLGVRTVETHRARLQAKLGLRGAVALSEFARRNGLIIEDPPQFSR